MLLTYKELENKRDLILLIEGEFWKKVRKSLFIKEIKDLQKCLSIKDLEEAFFELEKKAAYRVAVDLLSRATQLEGALKRKLKERFLSEEAADYAIRRLQEMGYTNERDDVERAIESYFRKGYGPRGVFAKLRMKTSLSDQELQAKIASAVSEEEQLEKMRELLERGKSLRFLASRGFPFHLISQLDESGITR
ncbi:MAG: RecX family transcriptional regulator [Candidatus Algichlamydia australiensis]|nr:RecX family transcriptional regulator [Chlamydiales bacterium]